MGSPAVIDVDAFRQTQRLAFSFDINYVKKLKSALNQNADRVQDNEGNANFQPDFDIANAFDEDGRSALHWMVGGFEHRAKHFDVVDTILDNRRNVNSPDHEGDTALHLAASYNTSTAIQHLMACGAVVNARNRKGQTALHKAVINGNRRNAVILHRIEPQIKDISLKTALEYIKFSSCKENANQLVRNLNKDNDLINVAEKQNGKTDCLILHTLSLGKIHGTRKFRENVLNAWYRHILEVYFCKEKKWNFATVHPRNMQTVSPSAWMR